MNGFRIFNRPGQVVRQISGQCGRTDDYGIAHFKYLRSKKSIFEETLTKDHKLGGMAF